MPTQSLAACLQCCCYWQFCKCYEQNKNLPPATSHPYCHETNHSIPYTQYEQSLPYVFAGLPSHLSGSNTHQHVFSVGHAEYLQTSLPAEMFRTPLATIPLPQPSTSTSTSSNPRKRAAETTMAGASKRVRTRDVPAALPVPGVGPVPAAPLFQETEQLTSLSSHRSANLAPSPYKQISASQKAEASSKVASDVWWFVEPLTMKLINPQR
jgi:hypothetical protein